MTTNNGTRINDNQNSLKAGQRGPTLLEDFVLREKITHFDHERIPDWVVHARGAAAHGVFQVYTCAGFVNDPKRETPVFMRFSTVAGSRGSSDLARDVLHTSPIASAAAVPFRPAGAKADSLATRNLSMRCDSSWGNSRSKRCACAFWPCWRRWMADWRVL